jgi:hypothetical protein
MLPASPSASNKWNEKDDHSKSDVPATPELLDNRGDEYVQSQGVTRMEAVHRAAQGKSGRFTLWAVGLSVIVCAWAYSLDSSTTSNFDAFATSSFEAHSAGLSALNIATNIISAVSKPFIAKIADIRYVGNLYAVADFSRLILF